jgi:Cys-rich four helix bundle protein (predicted Tat secretion target)
MERPMSRRDLLMGSAGTVVVAGLSATPAMAAEEHAGHGGGPQGLIAATNACVAEGETCLAHCLAIFASGDTSLATCAKRVSEMIPVCRAVSVLASLDAERLGQFLGPCIDVCTDCEKECRKHADKHAICKACADACARVVAESKKLKSA